MANLLLVCIIAPFLVALYVFRNKPKRSKPLPPGPKPKLFLGNAKDIPSSHKELKFAEWGKEYGDVVYLTAFSRPIIVLNSAKAAIDLLDKRSAIYSSRPHSHMADVMGYSSSTLLAPYGDTFRRARKLLNSALNSRTAKTYWPIQEDAVHKYLARLLEKPEQFREHVKRTSSGIILKVAYGYELKEEDPVLPLVEAATDSFGRAVGGGYFVDYLPILKRVPLTFWKAETRQFILAGRSLSVRIREELFGFVKRKMAEGTAEPSFTSTLLEARGTITGLTAQAEENLIKSTAAILYGAGSDTTAATIASFILAMTIHPEIQLKAQAELNSIVGSERLPTWDDRPSLPYIDAILKETLRWNTATPLGVPHALIQDDIYDGMLIPGGATVISNIWAIMRDPKEYEDPFTFKPERFLVENPPTDPHSYAFGFGRRSCPGKDVASATVFMSIACTLHCFSIGKAKDEKEKDIEPQIGWTTGLVMHPTEYGATFTPRSAKAVELIKTVNLD
ncbi:cytochrome P450 [Cantharellus anzutake]|uniref:cytochrome P450 n=1 Tax=Cantharellus anzutake TaxID=1750568 RepID=UPI00190325A0|nr:cytochrome P450 [Cantharellus anzutake]KAF8330883.1 cytochrome P450 [Cantharellus anzutake]